MTRLYANNFSTTLNGAITNVATTITLNSVTGLPAIGGGDTCQLTITDGTNTEIVTATAVSGFVVTVTRGQEGTSGTAFADGDTVELRATALSFSSSLLNTGGTATGDYDFGGASSLEIPNSATPTVNADGEIAVDTTVTDFSHGVLKYYGGEEMGVVAMPIAQFSTPTDGYVVSYNATNDEFELVAGGAGGGDAWSDPVDANIVPDADSTRNLGSSLNRFATLYVDDIVMTADIDGNDATFTGNVTAASGTISGSTVSATSEMKMPVGTGPTVNANGEIATDTSVTGFSHGLITHYSGETLFAVSMPTANLSGIANRDTLVYNSTDTEFKVQEAPGELLNVQVFTAGGTWTPTSGTNFVVVEVQAGGGGGGASTTTTAAQGSAGAGGGAGGYSVKLIKSGLGATETVTVGAGGAGGVGSGGAGSSGGTSSFGAHCSATGGAGGTASSAGTNIVSTIGGAAGSGSGGDVNIDGDDGNASYALGTGSVTNPFGVGGFGGSSKWGSGGATRITSSTTTGQAASGYGAGGGGDAVGASQTGTDGGAGSGGIVIVWEYA